MLKLALIAVAALGLFVPDEAWAQRTGSRIGETAQSGNARHARQAGELLAGCIAERRPDLARRWFQVLPGTPEEAAMVDRNTSDLAVCLDSDQLILDGREFVFDVTRMRPRVALALVKRTIGRAASQAPVPATTDPWFVPQLQALTQGAAVDREALGVQEFGHCVAVNAWAPARALLAALPDSREEAAAVRAISPVLGTCVNQGERIEITPASLRYYLAEPFLHLMGRLLPATAEGS